MKSIPGIQSPRSRRLAGVVPTMFFASVVVFSLEHIIPGGPALALLGSSASPTSIARLNREFGLNHPIVVQYFTWLMDALQGHLGTDYLSDQSVVSVIGALAEPTIEIVLFSICISAVFGLLIGVGLAYYPRSKTSRSVLSASAVGLSIPDFWLASIGVGIFALSLHLLPATGFVPFQTSVTANLRSVLIGVLTLSIINIAIITRQVRSALLGVLGQPYIRTLRAYGLSERRILCRYALPSAAAPLIVLGPLLIAGLLGGDVLVENVLSIPGLGIGVVQAVQQRDYPLLQAIVLLETLVVILLNVIADLLAGWIDPRLRLTGNALQKSRGSLQKSRGSGTSAAVVVGVRSGE